MSSHHIVREKQEPALYIHHLGDFDEEYLGQLLEWSPSLLVNSAEYDKIISLGLKIDIVVNPLAPYSFQENTKLIDTGSSDMDSVLEYLISEGYPAVNLIDATANLQHLENYISRINIVVFTESHKTYAVKSGFKVWKPAGMQFSIVTSKEFSYTNLIPSQKNNFEVAHDGFVSFTFNYPYLFISEML